MTAAAHQTKKAMYRREPVNIFCTLFGKTATTQRSIWSLCFFDMQAPTKLGVVSLSEIGAQEAEGVQRGSREHSPLSPFSRSGCTTIRQHHQEPSGLVR